jgi:YfiH family protein
MWQGGASPKPWESLNFSSASGDDKARVEANLERAAAELDVDPTRIYFLSQVHGIDHKVLLGSEAREAVLFEEGDITVSTTAGVACGVRMADCAAILLADPKSGAVAAVHSGWRGTVQNAARAGVHALRHAIGGNPALLAVVGPHIETCCFEVGADVASEIAACSPLGDTIVDRTHERPHVDLRRVIERQLLDAGVADVAHVRGCTMCDALRFHSYRRDGVKSGRMLAAIVARAASPSSLGAPSESEATSP